MNKWSSVILVNKLVILLLLLNNISMADSGKNKLLLANLVKAAIERTQHIVKYDGSYFSIPYPNGDIPAGLGVCTDVVIRSYRQVGIDLQQQVHKDMKKHFNDYPSQAKWGLKKPDKNIDHRRVPNLKVFFRKYGKKLSVTSDPVDYSPGDIVTWLLPGNLTHIGIVTDRKSTDGIPLIVHNIGAGPKLENRLFSYKITGHYTYSGN